jgi:hypothetical protein
MSTIEKVIIAVVFGGAIVAYTMWKKSQTAATTTTPASSTTASTTSTPAGTTTTSTPASTTTTASTVQTQQATVGSLPFVNTFVEGSKNQTIIQYQPVTDTSFTVGTTKVTIVSGPSELVGKTGTVWYIYKGTQSGSTVWNLYLDIPFTGATGAGTFNKV